MKRYSQSPPSKGWIHASDIRIERYLWPLTHVGNLESARLRRATLSPSSRLGVPGVNFISSDEGKRRTQARTWWFHKAKLSDVWALYVGEDWNSPKLESLVWTLAERLGFSDHQQLEYTRRVPRRSSDLNHEERRRAKVAGLVEEMIKAAGHEPVDALAYRNTHEYAKESEQSRTSLVVLRRTEILEAFSESADSVPYSAGD